MFGCELPHANSISHAAFSANARFLLTMSWDKSLRVWDLAPWLMLPPRSSDAFSADGSRRFQIESNKVRVFATISSNLIAERAVKYVVGKVVCDTAGTRCLFMPAKLDKEAVVAGYDFQANREISAVLSTLVSNNWSIAEGAAVATTVHSNTVTIYDLATGKALSKYVHQTPVEGLAVSHDGRRIAVRSGRDAQVIDSATGAAISPRLTHVLPVGCVQFNRAGTLLLTGCSDDKLTEGYAQLWDATTGAPRLGRFAHKDGISALAFSPDETLIATGGEDWVARVWDAKTGANVATFQHSFGIDSVGFSQDGKWLTTGSRDKTARVWDIGTVTPVTPPFTGDSEVFNTRFVGTGQLAVTDFKRLTRIFTLPRSSQPLDQIRTTSAFLSGQIARREDMEQITATLQDTYRQSAELTDSRWHWEQAYDCERLRLFAGAEFHLNCTVKLGYSRGDIYARLGNAAAENGHWTEARASYAKALGNAPRDVISLARLQLINLVTKHPSTQNNGVAALAALANESKWTDEAAWILALSATSTNAAVTPPLSAVAQMLAASPKSSEIIALAGLIDYRCNRGPLLKDFDERITQVQGEIAPECYLVRALMLASQNEKADASAELTRMETGTMAGLPWQRRARVQLLRDTVDAAIGTDAVQKVTGTASANRH